MLHISDRYTDIVTVTMGICYRCKLSVSYLWPSDVCMLCQCSSVVSSVDSNIRQYQIHVACLWANLLIHFQFVFSE